MGQADFYSQLKPAHHPAAIAALRAGTVPPPVHVQLVLSNLCNQDCLFCAYRISTGLSNALFDEGQVMPRTSAEEIIDDCAALGVKALQFTGGGEPTAHPDHLALIARAQAHGMDTALVTNGVRLAPSALAVANLTWIRVSVDAGDARMYAHVRRCPPAHWDRVWRLIRYLGKPHHYAGTLGVGFVVTPTNYEGIPEAARLARDAGAQNLRVGAVFTSEGLDYYGDSIPAIHDVLAAAKDECDVPGGFQVIDLFGRRLSDLEAGPPTHPRCLYQYLNVYVGADLQVYRCCNTSYTKAGRLGALANGARLRDLVLGYEPFDARQCRLCQFQGQNAALRALVHPPEHVNFV